MIETIIAKIAQKSVEAIPWVFSGVGISIIQITKRIFNSSYNNSLIVIENSFQEEIQEIREEPYSVSLGKRIKLLRKDYFKLNEREMADFCGYEEVAELTKYELGDK